MCSILMLGFIRCCLTCQSAMTVIPIASFVYLRSVLGIVDLVTVAHEVVLVRRTTHVGTVLRHEVVVRVAVGVGTDASHLRLVRRRDFDDGRPNTVALHHQTEVGRKSDVHTVVANFKAGE